MDKVQQIAKKYRRSQILCVIVAVILIYKLTELFTLIYPLLVPFVLVGIYVAMKKAKDFFWRKYIASVLIHDLDAAFYRDIILAAGVYKAGPLLAMESEFFAGNVSGALSIGEEILNYEKLAKKIAPMTLWLLAEYNFLIGDDVALASACKKFRELKLPKIKSKNIKRIIASIEKYEAYLSGYIEALLRPTGKKRKDALHEIVRSFYEARVALLRGEKESARALFSGLAVAADKIIIGTLSNGAVEAIDSGKEYGQTMLSLQNEPIDIADIFQGCIKGVKKSNRLIALGVIAFLIAGVQLIPWIISDLQWRSDERITVRLIEDQYRDIELYELIYIDDDEILFIAEADEGLLFGGRHLDENSEWQVSIYGYCSFDTLEQNVNYRDTFIKYDNSVQRYFCFSDDVSVMSYQDTLFHSVYWLDDLGAVYFVIDDEPIE